MTTSDKAKQKLVDSMRQSKTKAASAPSSAEKQPAKETKTVAKVAKPPRKAAVKTKARSATRAKKTTADSYQSSRRIWPD
ncbi:MAG: hypothetical protein EP297_10435 [Gammaproteobacteria bacterium]|nr:MAG: hypothetical protein EP297_10435 [Gammaproteobacteria bacterium]